MKPSYETIEKFQRIYFEEFNEKISKEEAYDKFLRLVNFLRVIIPPGFEGEIIFDRNPENDKLKDQ